MANVMQAVFAPLAPGHIPINTIGSGMSGAVAPNGEHLMQDYRAGKIVGSTNRNLTILQLIGVPVGALAVAVAYPLVRARYGIGGGGGSHPPPRRETDEDAVRRCERVESARPQHPM